MIILKPLAAAIAAMVLVTSAAEAQSVRRRGVDRPPAIVQQPRTRDGRPRDYLPPGTITSTTPNANGNFGGGTTGGGGSGGGGP